MNEEIPERVMREPVMEPQVTFCKTCGPAEKKLCRPVGMPVLRHGRYFQFWYCAEHWEEGKARALQKGWLIENTKPDFEVG